MTCGATSTFQEGETTWTFTCQADTGHEPGEHSYVLDPGQTPPGG